MAPCKAVCLALALFMGVVVASQNKMAMEQNDLPAEVEGSIKLYQDKGGIFQHQAVNAAASINTEVRAARPPQRAQAAPRAHAHAQMRSLSCSTGGPSWPPSFHAARAHTRAPGPPLSRRRSSST